MDLANGLHGAKRRPGTRELRSLDEKSRQLIHLFKND